MSWEAGVIEHATSVRQAKTWYPMLVEIYQNNFLLREINVVNLEVNPSFSGNIFDIHRLKSQYPPVASAIKDQQEPDDLNEVQKIIEDFTKIFE